MKTLFMVCGVFILLTLSMAIDTSAAPTVTLGSDPTATLTGAVRYRNFGGSGTGGAKEILVGVPGFAGAANGDVAWNPVGPDPKTRCVQISYDGSGTLTTIIAINATPCSFGTPLTTVFKSGLSLGTLNYLEIFLTKAGTTGTAVAFNSVFLGTDSLGSFALTAGAAATKWNVTGINLTAGFTLEGKVALTGSVGGGDSNFIEVDIGSVTPPDNEGPITTDVAVTPEPVLINGQGTVTATVDDSEAGGSDISSADYSLNGGADNSMDASDGAFDEVTEDVEATFTATQLGVNEVCVHGTDSLNNVGDPTCQTFCVTYSFDGFYTPIDNELVNVTKAGQAVPAKWRLTDANGVPIDDPESFGGLYSYPISCEDLQGDPLDSIEEVASGASGLQYNGDGYWQFNWKTPKTYAGTCRAMYVLFQGCSGSPVANFKFKN